MTILAVDPGCAKSGFVIWDGETETILGKGKVPNSEMLSRVKMEAVNGLVNKLVVEMVGHYGTGMPAGKEVFRTCVFIGEMKNAWGDDSRFSLALRKTVVAHNCGSALGKDGNARQALIDRFGAKGTKKAPGKTYGMANDMWQALALAVYAYDTKNASCL